MSENVNVIDIDEIKKRLDNGLISVRKHPFLDLFIYNYTSKTQHEKLWDKYTTICRGLIVDKHNNILNNPFHKFFNLGETEDTMIQNLPAEVPSITEKLDGMLGILYEEGDNPAIATRGAFDSPYAEWATNWLRLQGFVIDDFKKDHTYMFEIIYPGNKIIVNYENRSELVLLAVRSNSGDGELNYIKEAEELGLSYVKSFNAGSLDGNSLDGNLDGNDGISEALKYLEKCKGTECEGFVCRYSNGLRIKIKSEDYKRLHRLLFGLSANAIWDALRNNRNLDDIIGLVPEDFYTWVKKVESEVIKSKTDIMNRSRDIAKEAKKLPTRLEQYEYIKKCTESSQEIRGIVMYLVDDRVDKAEKSVWQKVKPVGEMFTSKKL